MKKILLALAIAAPILGFSQWKSASVGSSVVKEGKENIEATGLYSFDQQVFEQQLASTPERFSNLPGNIISIPNAEGEMERFEVWEASNFTPTLQAKFPNIRAYVGIGIDDPNAYLRFSFSSKGISTMTLRAGKSEFIEPYTSDNSKYIVFDSKIHRVQGEIPFECSTPETTALSNDMSTLTNGKSNTGIFKTFRLAQVVTGEYTQYFGGTVADGMDAINTTMTRVNGVFEKDFALRLILIDNNESLVFTDASTDPFSSPGNISTTQTQLQAYLNSQIEAENYDIGHIFHRSGGGGNAGCIGCICSDSNKGKGYTSPGIGGPEGDWFDIDFVAHEMGHQLGANHTFSHSTQEFTGNNVEPGSGSTIMGYAGITSYNVQAHSDDYFVYKSVQQVQMNLANKPCANNTTLTNQTPVANAGPDYNIPTGTAFVLTGTATDADGDALVYNWEQNDSGSSSTSGANSRVSFTKASGPNFRSNPHESTPVRYMPKFEYVLERDVNSLEAYWRTKWEAITSVTRVYNFAFTVRDNNSEGGQTQTDIMRVNVRNAGPFVVTNPLESQDVDLGTNSMLVEWDVAGTDETPINTANVRILLSTDDGANFTVVAESTPNDGSETITIPTGTTANTTSRIMIEAVDNIYYAVSRKFELSGTMRVTDVNQFSVGLYPNPNNGQFFLKANNVAKGDVKTTIFNTAGKKVFSQDTNHMGGSFNNSYNVKLPTGVYVIVIETADNKTTQKLVIN